jgi:hypothetical protein
MLAQLTLATHPLETVFKLQYLVMVDRLVQSLLVMHKRDVFILQWIAAMTTYVL